MDIEYIQEGDYLIPNLILDVDPEENAKPLGKYGLMREGVPEKPQERNLQYDADEEYSEEAFA